MDTKLTFNANNLSCIRQQRLLFSNLSFTIQSGEALQIEGANGTGKSSLLKIIMGLTTPNSGKVYWCDNNIHEDAVDFYANSHYIGHSSGLKLGLTVIENLTVAAHFYQEKLPENIAEVLEILQLKSHQNTLVNELSAGQKRRVALAKLWLFPRKCWLLDEPLTALDKDTQALFEAHAQTHLSQGGMLIVISHQPLQIETPIKLVRLSSC